MTFLISLGSNLPKEDAEKNILGAISYFQGYSLPYDIKYSSVYETAGVGSGEGKTYFNAVVKGETEKSAEEIVETLKYLETKMGRIPKELRTEENCGVVPIDLDLLSLGENVFKPKDLQMPYVLQGLSEIK